MNCRAVSTKFALGQALSLLLCASASAQVTPPAVLNPADPALRLWLDASTLVDAGLLEADPVASWIDQSSYATQMKPRTSTFLGGPNIGDPVEENPHLRYVNINGNNVPTVRFDRDGSALGNPAVDGSGSTDRLYQTNNLASLGQFDPLDIGDGTSLTTFIVFKPDVTNNYNEQGGPILGAEVVFGKRGSSSAVYQLGIWNFPESPNTNGKFDYITYDSNTAYFSNQTPTFQTWHVTSLVVTDVPNSSADQVNILDADDMSPTQTLTDMGLILGDGTPVTNVVNRNASTPEPFGIGAHAQNCCGEGETFAGNIAEMIIFAKTLTPTEYSQVSAYLSAKYFTAPATSLAGDYDGNGVVNGLDLDVWQDQIGDPVGAAPNADGNDDGQIDGQDFLIWQRGLGGSSVSTAANSVPEPATAVLVACGLSPLVRRRTRR
jgi:hypothetical protein